MRIFTSYRRTYITSKQTWIVLNLFPRIDFGAAYGTAKSGIGISTMGVLKPELIVKSVVPVVMAGILGIYGLIVSVILQQRSINYIIQFRSYWRRIYLFHGIQTFSFWIMLWTQFTCNKCFFIYQLNFLYKFFWLILMLLIFLF